ncbi:MAG: hypothetical protein AAF757_30140 [Cyanobacteria bacterium P01_D01_bin.116]
MSGLTEALEFIFNDLPEDVVEQKKSIYPSLTSMMENLIEELENTKIY